jgi:hypothetical protein
MALEGSLKEFNVADILQLIFFQKKTGVLYMQGRTDRVRVLFVDGNIVGAESRKRSIEKRLGMILLKRGILTRDDIDAVIEKQRAEGGKFGAVLVREGFVTKEQIQTVLSFQISEIMAQVFSMQEGRYEFKPQSIPVDKEVGVELNTEHYLMEGVRILDEWSEILGKITLDDVYVPTEAASSAELADLEVTIMQLADGEHDIADITDISGVDSFTISSTILSLAERGLMAKRVAVAEEQDVVAEHKVTAIPGLKTMLYVMAAAGLFVGIFVFLSTPKDFKLFRAAEQLDRIRHDVQVYYYETGQYPDVLAEGDELDPWGNPVLYSASTGGFTVSFMGPDGRPGTADDMPTPPPAPTADMAPDAEEAR